MGAEQRRITAYPGLTGSRLLREILGVHQRRQEMAALRGASLRDARRCTM
jgi:hypothetical protein